MNRRKRQFPEKESDHLKAAQAWIVLKNFVEANAALGLVSPEYAAHPEVLLLRCSVYLKSRCFTLLVEVADALVTLTPEDPRGWIFKSEALFEMREPQKAYRSLLPVSDVFAGNHLIPYMLARCSVALDRIDEANEWIQKAFKAESEEANMMRRSALDDPDIKRIWQ